MQKFIYACVINTSYDSSTRAIIVVDNNIVIDVIEVVSDANNRTNYVWDGIPNIIGMSFYCAIETWCNKLNKLDTEVPCRLYYEKISSKYMKDILNSSDYYYSLKD